MSERSIEMVGRPRLVTDDEIFDAIVTVISERGPSGATMDRIANEVGLTGPALAHRFGTKRQLFLALAQRQPRAVEDLIATKRAEHTEPLDALVGFYTTLVAAMTTKTEVANHLAMLNLDLTDPDLGKHARDQARVIKRCTTELLDEAGVANPADVAIRLYTTWSGAILTWAIDGTGTLSNWIRRHLDEALADTSSMAPAR